MRVRLRLRSELLLIIALASALPLAGFATVAHLVSRRALQGALLDRQANVAQERALALARELASVRQPMEQLAAGRPFAQSSPADVQAALTELFLRHDAVSHVALVGADGGVLSSLFVDDPEAFARARPEFTRHPVVSGAAVDAFLSRARAQAGEHGAVVSDLYGVGPAAADSLLLLSKRAPAGGERLALELRLPVLARGLVGESDDGSVVLADREGRLLAGARGIGQHVPELSANGGARLANVLFEGGAHFAARAAVPGAPLSIAVLRNEREALRPLESLSYATAGLLLATLLSAVLVGSVLARHLSRPINRLAEGALELAKGNLAHRIPGHRVPELDGVARAFNQMGEALDAANQNMMGFNEELQKQVAERTRELREAQSQLLRSQKLGAVIDLTSGLAHELNNPLAAIIGSAQLLQMELSPTDPLQARLQPIVAEGLRISRLLKRISALSDLERGNLVAAELHPLIERALSERKASLEQARAEVVKVFAPGLPPVLADAPALTEVVGHLIDNACQALEGRPARRIKVVTRTVGGQAVRLEISDTGKGIPRENLERIFNPFFTTSGPTSEKGPGLSLARCHQVVEAHGGKLSVDSDVGVGTTVAVLLPAAPPRAQLV